MKYAVVWLSLMACMAIAPFASHAAPVYDVTVIGSVGSAAYGINSIGQVVGQLTAGANQHAFYFDGTTVIDIGAQGGANSVAWGINDAGAVVGRSDATGAYVYAGGVLTALPANVYDARAINNAGTIVGTARFLNADGNNVPRAVTYAGGVVTNLGILPDNNGEGSYGYGIDNLGSAVGEVEIDGPPNRPSEPFLYSGGVMQDLGNLGGIFSVARAINDNGQVVGAAGGPYMNDGKIYPAKAFLWEAGILHDLGEFVPNGLSIAYDINNAGQIVGSAETTDGNRAFLSGGTDMVELDSLIDPATGWTITAANGINDLQQIAATACNLAGCYAVRLDLAGAIPEPRQAAMLVLGLIALCVPLRRRRVGPYDTFVNRARRLMVLPDTMKTPSPV